jgi:hypothetical protein
MRPRSIAASISASVGSTMDILPSHEKQLVLLCHHAHGAADFGTGHAVCPDKFGCAICPGQVDLGFTVTEDVDMGRFVIVDKNDHPQTMRANDSDQFRYNLSRWVFNRRRVSRMYRPSDAQLAET